jgi:hypothetical protein
MLSHYLHQWIHHPHLKLCWFGQHHLWIYLLFSKLSWVSCKKIFSLIYLLWALCLVLNTWHVNENDNQMHTCCQQIYFDIQNFSLFEAPSQYCNHMISTHVLFCSQREDWRLRPLTPEMIEYARTDAHYLLYIANCLASELHAEACGTF